MQSTTPSSELDFNTVQSLAQCAGYKLEPRAWDKDGVFLCRPLPGGGEEIVRCETLEDAVQRIQRWNRK